MLTSNICYFAFIIDEINPKKCRILLTQNGEVDFEVPGGRVAEVDAAAVDAGVRGAHVVDQELRRRRGGPEVGARPEAGRGGPQLGRGELATPHVETGNRELD